MSAQGRRQLDPSVLAVLPIKLGWDCLDEVVIDVAVRSAFPWCKRLNDAMSRVLAVTCRMLVGGAIATPNVATLHA